MSRTSHRRTALRAAATATAMGAVAALAAAGAAPASAHAVAHQAGPLVDLQLATADPTDGAYASVTAVRHHESSTFVFMVSGLPRSAAGRTFGAHVHTGTCVTGNGAIAGPHYNSDVAAGIVPAEISEATEVWLDFTVNPAGRATAVATVPFTIEDGAAGAVVIHALATDHHTGAAGARLACLPLDV